MLHEILYHRTAPWLVGEKKEEREVRFREEPRALAVEERFPGSYAGRVISIRPVRDVIQKRLPSLKEMASKDWPVVVLDLSPAEANAVACGGAKIVDGKLANVTFEDRHGAVAPMLRKQFAHPEEIEAYSEDEFDIDGRQFAALADLARDLLPAAETHTGTGLYSVKETPTHNDDTQSGAVAGQVVTLTTGGLGTSDAFKGGYVTNATRSETRAIVNHTNDTVTLEGDLSAWADTDDLDIYDAWSTIQGALDQLWTDQGATKFTAMQYVRIFAGTYAESDITPNSSLDPDPRYGYTLCIEGDPDDERANIVVATTSGTYQWDCRMNSCILRHMTWTSSGISNYMFMAHYSSTQLVMLLDLDITTTKASYVYRTLVVEDCVWTVTVSGQNVVSYLGNGGGGLFAARSTFRNTSGSASGSAFGAVACDVCFEACSFSNWINVIATTGTTDRQHAVWRWSNCTIHDCTYGIRPYRGIAGPIHVTNTIFKDVTYPFECDSWPEATASTWGPKYVLRNNCYHGYTAFADLQQGFATKTYAQFAALDFVDASGDLDATDPLLTDPAAGDFSLGTGSPCIHAGAGAGVQTGINGERFDPFHPDQGAWASGLGPNIAVGT